MLPIETAAASRRLVPPTTWTARPMAPELASVPRPRLLDAIRSRLACHQTQMRLGDVKSPRARCCGAAMGGLAAAPQAQSLLEGFDSPCLFGGDPVSLGGPEGNDSAKPLMRLSRYFLPILRETPKEAEVVSPRLMLRAGLIRQEAAGIYAWLPLGFRVLKKIEQIVREEQDRAGGIELLMPTLQVADLWRERGRYDADGPEMLRITDRHKRELLFGPTNEEMITEIFRSYVKSYRNLPLNLYHIQWKFRDEQRPRFGVMRGREFLMKDAYSFDLDETAARRSYNKMFVAYLRTFARMGLKAVPMRAETGPIGGDLSHEFIVLAETGESGVFCDSDVLNLPVPGEDVD